MAKKEQFTKEDDALLADLGVEVAVKPVRQHTAREERIIAGFEEIQRFVTAQGRRPQHGESNDIFERLYAVRLDRIRSQPECVALLQDLDTQRLLTADSTPEIPVPDNMEDEALLEELGVAMDSETSITNLKHVKSQAERRAAEEVANRTPCEDFAQFKPLFEAVQKELDSGLRRTIRFRRDVGFAKTDIGQGRFVIVGGQMAYVAGVGDTFKAPNGEEDARLRVIYANGTESDILLRSLVRAMYKDATSRFVTDADTGPLFSGEPSADDQKSGTVYVLRSHADHPDVQQHRNVLHKIGVTGGEVKKRLANARHDPTFLMADVEVVATYRLANIDRTRLEQLIHRFFGAARLDIKIKDRFGALVSAREWFVVPLFVIDELIEKIKDGTVQHYRYDAESGKLIGSG